MSAADQQAAALPWAAVELQQAPPEPDLPAKLGLGVGSRVEVWWNITLEQDGDDVDLTKWWGAHLDSKVDGQSDGEGRQVYMLKYDPDPEHGFEEHEMRAVTFLDDHVLYDHVEGEDACDLLHWRREGEAWEPPAADEAEDEAEALPLSLGDIVQQISAAERLRGRTVEQDTADALAELPAEKQLRIAAGFRDFSERIAAELSKLSEQHGADYVVTEADIKSATAAAMAAALGGGR